MPDSQMRECAIPRSAVKEGRSASRSCGSQKANVASTLRVLSSADINQHAGPMSTDSSALHRRRPTDLAVWFASGGDPFQVVRASGVW